MTGGQVGMPAMTDWSCVTLMKLARQRSARWQLTSAAAKFSVCMSVRMRESVFACIVLYVGEHVCYLKAVFPFWVEAVMTC